VSRSGPALDEEEAPATHTIPTLLLPHHCRHCSQSPAIPLGIRADFNSGKVGIVAINGLLIDINYVVLLIQDDSIYGIPSLRIGRLSSVEKLISVFQEQAPADITWSDVVCCGSAGIFTTVENDGVVPTVSTYLPLSLMSPCLCDRHETSKVQQLPQYFVQHSLLGTMAKVIHDNLHCGGTHDHSARYHCHHKTMDGCSEELLIPQCTPTGTAEAVCKVTPELTWKSTYMSLYVPNPNMSFVDLPSMMISRK
ncbi:LOW QUALITY PROTEIN: Glyceraldehyde-3-phosphate dehydrogenase, partial [Galemys pyrenaicus]